jgi:hypothetical protein
LIRTDSVLALKEFKQMRSFQASLVFASDTVYEAFKVESNDNDPAETTQFITRFLDSPAGAPFNNNPDGGPGVQQQPQLIY